MIQAIQPLLTAIVLGIACRYCYTQRNQLRQGTNQPYICREAEVMTVMTGILSMTFLAISVALIIVP